MDTVNPTESIMDKRQLDPTRNRAALPLVRVVPSAFGLSSAARLEGPRGEVTVILSPLAAAEVLSLVDRMAGAPLDTYRIDDGGMSIARADEHGHRVALRSKRGAEIGEGLIELARHDLPRLAARVSEATSATLKRLAA